MTIIMWMWGSTLLYITCHTNEKAVGMVVLILTICGSVPVHK